VTRAGGREWAIAAAIALACLLFGLLTAKPTSLRDYDQPLYLGIAQDLAVTGTYTNGRGGQGEPGAFAAPLYPALIAGLIPFSPALARAAAACVRAAPVDELAACPADLGLLLPVQVALATLTLVLCWRTGLAVTGRPAVAWGALLAAGLGTVEYAVYARTAMTEALGLSLAALAGLLLVVLVRSPRLPAALGLGVSLGLLTLTRPEYLYLVAALGLVGMAALAVTRRFGVALLAAVLTAALVIAPWSVRNERLFGTPMPTYGYAGAILAERMAYEAMRPGEWVALWLYALPSFGPAAARMTFPARDIERLGWEERPDTFYMVGIGQAQAELRRDAPDPADQVSYLVRRFVAPAPLHFLAVTLVMAWKGLWVRKYLSLVGVPFFLVMLVRAIRQRDGTALAFLLPPTFILLLHAATTVSTPRYSLVLIPAYATALAAGVAPWVAPWVARSLPLLRRRFA